MLKLESLLKKKICNIKIKEYFDIIGYSLSFSTLSLVSSQVIYNLVMHNRAVVYADLSTFNEYVLEIPLVMYATAWNLKKLYNFSKNGKFNKNKD